MAICTDCRSYRVCEGKYYCVAIDNDVIEMDYEVISEDISCAEFEELPELDRILGLYYEAPPYFL